jgi:carbamoyltransferase
VEIPAYYVNHHVAHAASCFYRSPFEESAILTHDGFGNGVGYHSGLILYGRGHELVVLSPHHLAIGSLYDSISLMLRLYSGGLDGAGKLMGLAPYGKPRFFQRDMVGNWFDAERRFKMNQIALWHRHCNAKALELGYDLSSLGNRDRMTDPINADLAASTQMLFEECYLQAVRATKGLLQNSGIESDNLCLSGGTALNCPSNSRVFQDGAFGNMFIEPSCGDEGLAVGGALYIHHHLYRNPVLRDADRLSMSPYLGIDISEAEVERALRAYAPRIRFEKRSDAPEQAAKDVMENKVIGWFEGRSESGPRALGHRSIVANPMHRENWERVNRIKQREVWRPFAPSVLEEESPNWFKGLPHPSPYMLFTGQVISSSLPAITHVDGSSRIQTVDSSAGDYYRMIKAFHRLSGVPVVLNTSLNGPGEPIVETPEHALAFYLNSELDALYMNGFKITRTGTD